MNYEELSEKEKSIWENLAVKHQKLLQIIKNVAENGCMMCKSRPKNWQEFSFHVKSTHGIPHEILMELVK